MCLDVCLLLYVCVKELLLQRASCLFLSFSAGFFCISSLSSPISVFLFGITNLL